MAPPPSSDHRISEKLIEAFRELALAIRDSSSQRSSEFKGLVKWLEEHASEEKQALLELIAALKKKGFRITVGDGENTSSLHLGDGHWLAVRPIFIKVGVWVASTAVFAKFLSFLSGGP